MFTKRSLLQGVAAFLSAWCALPKETAAIPDRILIDDPRIYAVPGDTIVCNGPDQHIIAEFMNHVYVGDLYDPKHIGNWQQPIPKVGTLEQPCTVCGAQWFAGSSLHFRSGWR